MDLIKLRGGHLLINHDAIAAIDVLSFAPVPSLDVVLTGGYRYSLYGQDAQTVLSTAQPNAEESKPHPGELPGPHYGSTVKPVDGQQPQQQTKRPGKKS